VPLPSLLPPPLLYPLFSISFTNTKLKHVTSTYHHSWYLVSEFTCNVTYFHRVIDIWCMRLYLMHQTLNYHIFCVVTVKWSGTVSGWFPPTRYFTKFIGSRRHGPSSFRVKCAWVRWSDKLLVLLLPCPFLSFLALGARFQAFANCIIGVFRMGCRGVDWVYDPRQLQAGRPTAAANLGREINVMSIKFTSGAGETQDEM